MPAKLKNPWAVLALLFLVRISVPIQFQALPALAPFLVGEGALSYANLGLLTGLYMLPGAAIALPGGLLASAFGSRGVAVVGLVLMVGGMGLFAQTGSYPVMAVSRLISGTGAVLLTVQVPRIVTDHFHGGKIATAMAISASSFGFGMGVATGVLGALAEAYGLRAALLVTAALPALGLAAFLLLYEEKSGAAPAEGPTARGVWHIGGREAVLACIAGLIQVGFVTGFAVFMGFAPTLLMERGIPVVRAGLMVSLAGLMSLATVPLGGFLTDLTGRKNLLIAGGAVGTALSCLMLPLWGPALLWIALFGIIRGGCTGGIQSLPGEVLRPHSRATGFGLYYTMHYLGQALLLPVAGLLLDRAGSASAAVWFSGFLWLAIPGFLGWFRYLQRRWVALPA